MAAPTGRATKPIKKVEKESKVPMKGPDSGKNLRGNTVAAATPYSKKSYHSMLVESAEAPTAVIRRRCFPASVKLAAFWTKAVTSGT